MLFSHKDWIYYYIKKKKRPNEEKKKKTRTLSRSPLPGLIAPVPFSPVPRCPRVTSPRRRQYGDAYEVVTRLGRKRTLTLPSRVDSRADFCGEKSLLFMLRMLGASILCPFGLWRGRQLKFSKTSESDGLQSSVLPPLFMFIWRMLCFCFCCWSLFFFFFFYMSLLDDLLTNMVEIQSVF